MNMKDEIRRQLQGSIIIARCEQEPGILFKSNLCSGNNCIRFSTNTIEKILPDLKSKAGAWKTGILLQYEIYNKLNAIIFQLSLSGAGLNKSKKKRMEDLLKAAKASNVVNEKGIIAVRQWKYSTGADVQNVRYVLNEFFEYELPFFELELNHWLNDHSHLIMEFPKLDDVEELIEGKEINIHASRFERSKEARKKCIAHYGTACRICGFDFGKTYGQEFASKIEVHHIVPISKIDKDYVVDPIRDLIPVCSNCHTALHSKQDGVYTPKEIKQFLKINN